VAKSNCNTSSPPLQLLILPKGLPQAIRQRSQDVVHGRAFAGFDHDFGPHAGIQLTSVELLELRGIDDYVSINFSFDCPLRARIIVNWGLRGLMARALRHRGTRCTHQQANYRGNYNQFLSFHFSFLLYPFI
jgi:hypothetical protein